MKGVSTVIATILMLMITIGLAGVAASYIFGWFKVETAVALTIDEDMTECAGTTITVWVRNDGTQSIGLNTITIGGTDSTGSAMTSTTCAGAGNTGTGRTVQCTNTLTGTSGTNQVTARTSAGKSTRATVACA